MSWDSFCTNILHILYHQANIMYPCLLASHAHSIDLYKCNYCLGLMGIQKLNFLTYFVGTHYCQIQIYRKFMKAFLFKRFQICKGIRLLLWYSKSEKFLTSNSGIFLIFLGIGDWFLVFEFILLPKVILFLNGYCIFFMYLKYEFFSLFSGFFSFIFLFNIY